MVRFCCCVGSVSLAHNVKGFKRNPRKKRARGKEVARIAIKTVLNEAVVSYGHSFFVFLDWYVLMFILALYLGFFPLPCLSNRCFFGPVSHEMAHTFPRESILPKLVGFMVSKN